MKKSISKIIRIVIISFICLLIGYYSFWPVPIEPVPWISPPPMEYTGPFKANNMLVNAEKIPLLNYHGPEDIIINSAGYVYAATSQGIIRLKPDGSELELWYETQGRPLGIVFDKKENLIVADAFSGLLQITRDKKLTVLADRADGKPILYADNVDVADNGIIYFTDASTKFGAQANGGTWWASVLDIVEHDNNGRLLSYNPGTGKTSTLADKICFANGVAVSKDQTFLLVVETGSYKVKKYWLKGPKKGTLETIVENLPASPDNITTGANGRFWIGLIQPRSAILDGLSEYPTLRKIIFRTPGSFMPYPPMYGHVIAVNDQGDVVASLQDPSGSYPKTTGATEVGDYLYIHSLTADFIGRLNLKTLGIK